MSTKEKAEAQDWNDKQTVVGIVREVFIIQPYSQDGAVIGIPIDEEVRDVAKSEVIACAMKRFGDYPLKASMKHFILFSTVTGKRSINPIQLFSLGGLCGSILWILVFLSARSYYQYLLTMCR